MEAFVFDFSKLSDEEESLFVILRAYKAPCLKLLLLEESLYKVGLSRLPKGEFQALILFL